MLGTKYLSELVDFKQVYANRLNVIQAPTGSGKTYFALNTIPELCRDPLHQVLFLIDTTNGKDQILRNYNAQRVTKRWIEDIKDGGLWFIRDKHVVIMTYALLGCILADTPDFCEKFEFIICDELQNCIKFETYSPKPNHYTIAKNSLYCTATNYKTTIIALSATPQKIYGFFKEICNTLRINQNELRHYEVKNVINFNSIRNLIKNLNPNEIGICFTYFIGPMIEISKIAAAAGLKPICIWSTNNTDHIMSEEQLRVRSVILEEYRIPSEYNFLIINSSSETSIKIKSKVDYVIVDSPIRDTQIQVKGRVDHDFDVLYLLAKSKELNKVIQIPEEYLGKELYTKDKEKLCIELDIRENGRLKKWPSIKKMLIDNGGYEVAGGRNKNLRYDIITKVQE